MRLLRISCLLLLTGSAVRAQIDVGDGAPNEAIRQRFTQAFFRRNFIALVTMPPAGQVRKLGATGLVQEFNAVDKSGGNLYALVKGNAASINLPPDTETDVFQVYPRIYSYFTSLGSATVGYPTGDTQACPTITNNACTYQFFDKNYALFAYDQSADAYANSTFAIRDPFYTRWTALGGMGGPGPANSAEQAITSLAATKANLQTYLNGAIYSITSGVLNGKIFGVKLPIYTLYLANGAHAGLLGLPTGDELLAPDNRKRQSFEGGSIDYVPGSDPVLRYSVGGVSLSSTETNIRMKLGESLAISARVLAVNGDIVTDRTVTWTTSNSRVVSIQANGASATLKAVAGGTATVQAIVENRASPRLTILVTAPCCSVGEGAPTTVLQQAFQDTVTRAKLSLQLPSSTPVLRLGSGHVQEFYTTGNPPTRILIAVADRASQGTVVAGAILDRYYQLGGPAGPLGYPAADASPGGTQLFENGALAGNPVRVVSNPILARWAVLGYDTGAAGPPVSDEAAGLSFSATVARSQVFRNGTFYAIETGPNTGKVFFVSGLTLAAYNAAGGPAGKLGVPATDEFMSGGKRRQEFEGGVIEYWPGADVATVTESERSPLVYASPDVAVIGTRVRIGVGGFSPGARLRISLSGQPDFQVETETGAYTWEFYVPAGAAAGRVTVRAVDTAGSDAAQGYFVIRQAAEAGMKLRKIQGDTQTGLPGARLPLPLRIQLKDDEGNPVSLAAVRFTPSPGAQVVSASPATDDRGEAEAVVRLPSSEGIALFAAEAGRQVTSFSARVAPASLQNYPRQTQPDPNGALVAAASSVLRYHQNRNDLPAPNGPSDPAALAAWLKAFCVLDTQGGQICDGFATPPGASEAVANPWRINGFVGGALDVVPEKTESEGFRDLLAQGYPVIVALAMSVDEAPAGSHFVVAIGVAADSSVLVHDPNPTFGRATLGEYQAGFRLGSRLWKGTPAAAFRLAPRLPPATGFLVSSALSQLSLTSPAGACGAPLAWPARAATPESAAQPGEVRWLYCDGTQSRYQLDLNGETARAAVTDLASPGRLTEFTAASPASFLLTRPATQWTAAPQEASVSSIVNGASLTPGVAPGGLMTIFGQGLARGASKPAVEVGGVPATVINSWPFQLDVQVPPDSSSGSTPLVVRSPFGTVIGTLEILDWAPAILLTDGGKRGAVANQDKSMNEPRNPARRGQAIIVYATGLGAVVPQRNQMATRMPVTVLVGGIELQPGFAGLSSSVPGLYQVDVTLPASLPPGFGLPLQLRQGESLSNTVTIAVY